RGPPFPYTTLFRSPHAAIDLRAGRVTFEARAVAAAEVAHAVLIQRHLARRQQPHTGQRLERTLRVRVEMTDRVDGVIEEVNAQRLCIAHREHIEQRTAQCELAGYPDLGDMAVASGGQLFTDARHREALTGGQIERAPGDIRHG